MQCRARDVLDTLHQLDEPLLTAWPNRSESDTTVTDHHGGDTVAGRGVEHRIPCRLTVVVRVDVHESRSDHESGRIDGLGRISLDR